MAENAPKVKPEGHNRNWAPPLLELHNSPPVQTNLEMRNPGDKPMGKHVEGTDHMAHKVMMAPYDKSNMVMMAGNPDNPTLRMKPQVQKNEQMGYEEEEGVQMQIEEGPKKVQLMEHGEEEKVQMKCESCGKEGLIQRDIHEGVEEEMVQPKCAECEGKDVIQKSEDGTSHASTELTSSINSTKGQGSSLPKSIRQEMGSKMGADFDEVTVHNNSQAADMSNSIGAKAFTHGNDIYFNKGQYNPSSQSGKHLLAHELTHTIQQSNTKSTAIQRVELTYDDGPDAKGETQKIIDDLNATGAKATFYVVGRRIENGDNWKVVFNIAAGGHWLGNHAFDWNMESDNHVFLEGTISERAAKILKTEFSIIDALKKGKDEAMKSEGQAEWNAIPIANQTYINEVISGGTGRFRTPGFRSKFWKEDGRKTMDAIGVVNEILESAGLRKLEITKVGLLNVEGVDIDPEDWRAGRTQEEIEQWIIEKLSNNEDSILLHSRIAASAAATPEIIQTIKDKGFSFDPTIWGTRSPKIDFGFDAIEPGKDSPEWISKFMEQVSPIGYKDTLNVTDPIDRQIVTQKGVVWAKHSNGTAYLTLIEIKNSLVGGRPDRSTSFRFITFVEGAEIGKLALDKGKTAQSRGVQELKWTLISNIPNTAAGTTMTNE